MCVSVIKVQCMLCTDSCVSISIVLYTKSCLYQSVKCSINYVLTLIVYTATDPERFRGSGISFRAKIIGVDEVPEPRGDKMCQESLQKLKAIVRSTGQHKRRVFINITLEGLKIMDGITMVSNKKKKIALSSLTCTV